MSSKKSKAQVSPGTQGASVPWLGIDIGGANLKLAHNQSPIPDRNASERDTGVGKTRVWTKSIPFPMWKESKNLAATLARAIDDFPEFHGIAVTMTGELADCFATRAEGVACILEQVTRLFPAPLVYVYCVDGSWRSPSQAARDPWQAAASNWHALANWSRRLLPKRKSKGRSAKDLGGEELGVVVDIGSTTIDVIGISDQKVLTRSRTDSDRLKRRELIYTGVERSNLSGLLRSVPLHGKQIGRAHV